MTELIIVNLSDVRSVLPPRPAEPAQRPTWHELVAAESRLATLMIEIAELDGTEPEFCANERWYGRSGFKARLKELVGWYAETYALRTAGAYEVAYDRLYDALPPCRHQGMCR